MAQLFGFSIDDSYKKPSPSVVSPVPRNNEDGADYYLASGFYGQYLDVEGVFKTEYDLIRRYREMALHPEVDSAIEDILCEAIVADQNDSPIQIDLENLQVGPKIKDIIRGEFQYIQGIYFSLSLHLRRIREHHEKNLDQKMVKQGRALMEFHKIPRSDQNPLCGVVYQD